MPGDKTPRTPFGAAVREKRRARGLSQCDLAEACALCAIACPEGIIEVWRQTRG